MVVLPAYPAIAGLCWSDMIIRMLGCDVGIRGLRLSRMMEVQRLHVARLTGPLPEPWGPVRRFRCRKYEPAHSALGGSRSLGAQPASVSLTFSMINIVSTVTSRPSTLSPIAFTAWL
jgi:hypothetical protein